MLNRIFTKLRHYKEKLVSSIFCMLISKIVYFHSNPMKEIFVFCDAMTL